MQRSRFGHMQCPIARSLERVGEWWNILILRDALHGLTRFDEFQKTLNIAPGMLTRRLNGLVEARLLERRQYNAHPPRYEYVLTERGRDFRPVLLAMLAWGNKHFAPEGASVIVANRDTGAPIEPQFVDSRSRQPLTEVDCVLAPGPAANQRTKRRLAFAAGEVSQEKYRDELLARRTPKNRRQK